MSDSSRPTDVRPSPAEAEGHTDGDAVRDAVSERTGVPEVDGVLAEIESVGELPVADRVEVFERAHERLRRALEADPTAQIVEAVRE